MKIIELDLKDLIKTGVEKNILIFDGDGPFATFTLRLLYLMIDAALVHCDSRLKELYLPSCVQFDNLERFIDIVKSHHLTIHFSYILSELNNTYFQKELGGSLVGYDHDLVVGVTEKGIPILGSF